MKAIVDVYTNESPRDRYASMGRSSKQDARNSILQMHPTRVRVGLAGLVTIVAIHHRIIELHSEET